ncbi:hypothetical protein cypCar_00048248, partial [Cyprinus carpio]
MGMKQNSQNAPSLHGVELNVLTDEMLGHLLCKAHLELQLFTNSHCSSTQQPLSKEYWSWVHQAGASGGDCAGMLEVFNSAHGDSGDDSWELKMPMWCADSCRGVALSNQQ